MLAAREAKKFSQASTNSITATLMLSIAPTLNAFAGPLNVPARAAVKMAVEAPITKVAGDYGFDPLGLGTVRHASVTPARSPTPLTPLLSRYYSRRRSWRSARPS